ncbi:methylmalonyl-CoA mutase subunit beta [Seonamhaeicola sp. ML3]|uniref:methylmalonyl-CoA mutase subunit beta n=1 Tax=Seonamhaeicola sp. ML3 TaxID=2937786 RepID=UPI00200F96C1|nr:methylmalonyl-CoA mutase subunit beta [Seonamhaeicola sp. ML3]
MSKLWFNEFDAVSAKQWKQKIQFDLNGADYNDTLVWNSPDDISVKPFYLADDFKKFLASPSTKASKWKICETIFVSDIKESNLKATNALKKGAESIRFIIPSEDFSVDDLLENINVSGSNIHLEPQFLSPDFFKNLNTPFKTEILTHTDIIGNLAKTGNWFNNLNDDFSKFKSIVNETKTFSINASLYQNAGANMVQQLAYALTHANEYLNALEKENINLKRVVFNVAIGSNYFFEIAKLRALRLLWKTLASEYNTNLNCHIFSTPTKRNKTIYDHNTNLVRTTTECMSAILGGADTINNVPFDLIYRKPNAFSERTSRNQLLILKHESYFNKVNNPSDGSYYIESLTNQIAEKALTLFKDIEANDGFLKQLKVGTIQRKIKDSAEKEQTQFNTSEKTLVGTNKYIDEKDKMKKYLEIYPFVKIKKRKTLIAPIVEKRLAETIEQKRLKTED